MLNQKNFQKDRDILHHFTVLVDEYNRNSSNAQSKFTKIRKYAESEYNHKQSKADNKLWKDKNDVIVKYNSKISDANNKLTKKQNDTNSVFDLMEINYRKEFDEKKSEIKEAQKADVDFDKVKWLITFLSSILFSSFFGFPGFFIGAVVGVIIVFIVYQIKSINQRKHELILANILKEYKDNLEKLKIERESIQPKLTEIRNTHDKAIIAFEKEKQEQIAKVKNEYDKTLVTIQKEKKEQISEAEKEYNKSVEAIRQEFNSGMSQIMESCTNLNQFYPSWTDNNCSIPNTIPPAIRFGTLKYALGCYDISIPALLNFPFKNSLLYKTADTKKITAILNIQSLSLRLLSVIPPGKLKFVFIDPVSLGQNISPFMHLADYDENLVNGKAWSEKQHIEKCLTDMTEHMENVIQKYLRNQYSTIEEFNTEAGEVAESYRLLVVIDFPVNFSEESAKRLVSIVQNGPRCGIYILILWDTAQKLPYGFNPKDLEQYTTTIYWDTEQKRFVWEDPDFKHCQLELEKPPDNELFNKLVNQIGEAAKEASKVEVPFEEILKKSNLYIKNWWKATTLEDIQSPLGPIGATKVQQLDFGKGTSQHALVCGKTGSGKSTLLHVLITTIALKYSPNEAEFYLIDFKKGVEFKRYAIHQLPHARVIAIESEREFGLSVLEGLDAELKRRGDLFRSKGVDSLQDYRRKNSEKMPRILLLVDEFQEFFTPDDAIASKSSQILDRLVRQGRAFGIHVLLGSQTLAGAYTLARSTIDQMAVRIALQCSEADSRLILSDDNAAARLLSRPGEAIYNAANGLVEGNNPFQVAWLPDEKQEKILKYITLLAKNNNYQPPKPQIVFEGNVPAAVEKNQPLNDLLSNPNWSESLRKISAWLGEPIAIKDATVANFRRQSGSNLLIVGQNDEAAMSILTTGILTLAAQQNPSSAKFYILDFGSVDAHHAEYFKHLSDILSHPFQHGRRRQLPDIINEITKEVEYRMDDEDASLKKPANYLIIYGLQRARDLQQDDSFGGFPFEMPSPSLSDPDGSFISEMPPTPPPNPAKQFPKILREGPDLGIHTLIWCDTLTNLNRKLDRQVMREFEMRLVFQMSSEDSSNLIDTPAAGKLGQHRALFYSEEEGRLEKFRPFGLPSEIWLKEIEKKFKNALNK